MRAFFLVLKFELKTLIQKKSFIISTVLVVFGVFALLSLPRFFHESEADNNASQGDASEKDIMIIMEEQHILADPKLIEMVFPEYQIRFVNSTEEVQEAILQEEAEAGFVIHDATSYTYYVKNSSLTDMTSERFSTLLQQQYQASELAKLNVDALKVNEIYNVQITSDVMVLGTDGFNNYFYTYALIFVLYMMILIYGNQIGVSVASEKSNRAIEILTTSCSPNALIFGKVIAGAIAGVLQTGIMLGAVLLAYQLNADSLNHILDPYLSIPSTVIITFTLFGVLGYLLFSFMYGAIGAMCSKMEEVNGATMPIQLFIVAVFVISMLTLQMPDTLLATIAMYVPFTSWMCMFVSVAVGSVSVMEIAISLILLTLTTIGMGLLGAKLYRRGTLTYGNALKLKNIVQYLKSKD